MISKTVVLLIFRYASSASKSREEFAVELKFWHGIKSTRLLLRIRQIIPSLASG